MVYHEYENFFSKANTKEMRAHRERDQSIDLEPGAKLPFGRVCNMSEAELRALKVYIDKYLANRIIQHSTQPAASPVVFQK